MRATSGKHSDPRSRSEPARSEGRREVEAGTAVEIPLPLRVPLRRERSKREFDLGPEGLPRREIAGNEDPSLHSVEDVETRNAYIFGGKRWGRVL